jgi:hypothetical protein
MCQAPLVPCTNSPRLMDVSIPPYPNMGMSCNSCRFEHIRITIQGKNGQKPLNGSPRAVGCLGYRHGPVGPVLLHQLLRWYCVLEQVLRGVARPSIEGAQECFMR